LSADRKTIYAICFDDPKDEFAIKGIQNNVVRASVLGYGEVPVRKLGGASWAGIPGIAWVTVPREALDADATVIKLELEDDLRLYSGHGDPITFN
jgi:alpha-L-fucosidase